LKLLEACYQPRDIEGVANELVISSGLGLAQVGETDAALGQLRVFGGT
jgi:hypothetical protein